MVLNVLQNCHTWKNCKCLANSNIGILSLNERIMICLNNTNQLSSCWSSKCGPCLLCSLLGLWHLEVHWGVIFFHLLVFIIVFVFVVVFAFYVFTGWTKSVDRLVIKLTDAGNRMEQPLTKRADSLTILFTNEPDHLDQPVF